MVGVWAGGPVFVGSRRPCSDLDGEWNSSERLEGLVG